MDFFTDLLTSYALLKKRKFRITLDEAGKKPDELGKPPSFAALLKMRDSNTKADSTVQATVKLLTSMFPGVDVESPTIPGKQSVTSQPNLALAKGLSDELQLIPGSEPIQTVTEEEEKKEKKKKPTTNGDSGSNTETVGTDEGCGAGVVWPQHPKSPIVKKNCSVDSTVLGWYRTAVGRYYWGGGEGAEEAGVAKTPQAYYLENSNEGAALLDLYKDSPEVRTQLIKLMDRGWDATEGKPESEFYDPEKKRSIFAVLNKTIREGKERGVKLGTLGDMDLGKVIATEEQVLGAVSTMIKSVDIIRNKNRAADNELSFIRDNLNFVISEDGTRELYFNAGDDTGINFTAAPGMADRFLKDFDNYNNFLEKKKDDDPDFDSSLYSIPIQDRESNYRNSDAALDSNQVVTELSEQADQIMLLLYKPDSEDRKKGSKTNHQRAAELYTDLRDKWGDNLNKALRVIQSDLPSEGFALTEEWTLVQDAVKNLKSDYGDLQFEKFAEKLIRLRADQVRGCGADYILRVGTGGGKKGFKSDQFYLFTDKDKAKKFQGTGFDKTPQNIKQLVTGSVPPEKAEQAWKDFKNRWGDVSDDQEVYVGYDSLKYETTGRYRMGKQPPVRTITSTLSSELSRLGSSRDPEEAAWLKGMTSLFKSKDHIPKVMENLDSISEKYANIDRLQNAESTTLTTQEVRNELWGALGGADNPLNISDEQVKKLTTQSDDPKDILMAEKVKKELQNMLFSNSIREGLESEDADTRESWKHTMALLIARGAYDRNDANDTVVNPKKNKTARHKRNKLIKDTLSSFMGSDSPSSEVSWYDTVMRVGSIGFSLKKDITAVDFNVPEGYYPGERREDSSTEYSSTELMHKLLEVQELMFSHLIKE